MSEQAGLDATGIQEKNAVQAQAALSLADVMSPVQRNSHIQVKSPEAAEHMQVAQLTSTPIIRQECSPGNIDRLRHDIEEKQRQSQNSRTEQDRRRLQDEAGRFQQQLNMLQSSCSRPDMSSTPPSQTRPPVGFPAPRPAPIPESPGGFRPAPPSTGGGWTGGGWSPTESPFGSKQKLSLTGQGLLAQAGIAIAEQYIFSTKQGAFPNQFSGRMIADPRIGLIRAETPNGGEMIAVEAVIVSGKPDLTTRVYDAAGINKLQTIDQSWDAETPGTSNMHTIVNGAGDTPLFTLSGAGMPIRQEIEPGSTGIFKNDTATSVQKGNQKQDVKINVAAVSKDNNMLDITATITPVDANGQPLMENGKPKQPFIAEVIMQINPNNAAATYQLRANF